MSDIIPPFKALLETKGRKTGKTYKTEFGIETEVFTKEEFNEIGHGGNEQFGAMSYKPGFAINPLKFLIGLANAANEAGQRAEAFSYMAEFYLSMGNFQEAIEQLKIALTMKPITNIQKSKYIARLNEVEEYLDEINKNLL